MRTPLLASYFYYLFPEFHVKFHESTGKYLSKLTPTTRSCLCVCVCLTLPVKTENECLRILVLCHWCLGGKALKGRRLSRVRVMILTAGNEEGKERKGKMRCVLRFNETVCFILVRMGRVRFMCSGLSFAHLSDTVHFRLIVRTEPMNCSVKDHLWIV